MVQVTDEAGLDGAIATFNGDTVAGSYTIDISGTITEGPQASGCRSMFMRSTTKRRRHPGDRRHRGQRRDAGWRREVSRLLVYSGNVTIENLAIIDAKAIGGVGGSGGGGGGAGLGGGLFVAGDNATAPAVR